MTFRSVTPVTWTPVNPNDEITGVLVDVEYATEDTKSNKYKLQTLDGRQMQFWGKTVLDSKMAFAKKGDTIKVIFLGKKKPEKGGKEYYDYDVQIDDGNFASPTNANVGQPVPPHVSAQAQAQTPSQTQVHSA